MTGSAPCSFFVAVFGTLALGLFAPLQAQSRDRTSKPPPAPLVSSLGVIAADRLPLPGTWENAGVEGGIPRRSDVCADLAIPPYTVDRTGRKSAVAVIQGAIDNCRPGQVVAVPAGEYRIDGRLKITKGITVRGAGPATVFNVLSSSAILVTGAMPWPPPKNNPEFHISLPAAYRGSTTIRHDSKIPLRPGMMIMLDEVDTAPLVWNKGGASLRSRASLHLVEANAGGSVRFRPPLPIDYRNAPRMSWFPDVVRDVGIEDIRFVGTGSQPRAFIEIYSAWNAWVKGADFSNMPKHTVLVAWSGHVELRKNRLQQQSNGGPNSQGLDLISDVNWSLVVDNICSAGGFPGINIGDGGASANYSGGFGNVVAYNYCVDSFYTDPPESRHHGPMAADIGSHTPHPQYNLFEGNVLGKFGAEAYHGSASHFVLFRNLIAGANRWRHATHRTAIQIDRRNLYFSIVGNVLGVRGAPSTYEYAARSNWSGSTLLRLGFPDVGNPYFSGTHPPAAIPFSNGGPRDLYVDRTTTPFGTTLIEGNWWSVTGKQDWSGHSAPLPPSLFLVAKPQWFGSLAWPPVDPGNPAAAGPEVHTGRLSFR